MLANSSLPGKASTSARSLSRIRFFQPLPHATMSSHTCISSPGWCLANRLSALPPAADTCWTWCGMTCCAHPTQSAYARRIYRYCTLVVKDHCLHRMLHQKSHELKWLQRNIQIGNNHWRIFAAVQHGQEIHILRPGAIALRCAQHITHGRNACVPIYTAGLCGCWRSRCGTFAPIGSAIGAKLDAQIYSQITSLSHPSIR